MKEIDTKLFQIIKKRQNTSKLSDEQKINCNDSNKEIVSKDVQAVRELVSLNKEKKINVMKELSDEEVIARIYNDEKKSILGNLLQRITCKDVQQTNNINNAEVGKSQYQNELPEIILDSNNNNTEIILSESASYKITVMQTDNTVISYELKSLTANDNKILLYLDDNRLIVKGNDIKAEIKTSGISDIMLLGSNNSITTADGQTHISNANISYSSCRFGSSLTVWDNKKSSESNSSELQTLTLNRGDDAVILGESEGTSELFKGIPLELTLTNPFTGTNYKYTISLKDKTEYNIGTPVFVSPKFEFLSNGRLVITGDYLNIVAHDNQEDDIILIGKYNTLNTGNMDDKVRVGYTIDGNNNYYNQNSPYNIVNTGSGNDMVTVKGANNTINMGNDGNDTCIGVNTSDIANVNGSNLTRIINKNISNENFDYNDGWSTQSSSGGICGTLALINSLCNNPISNGLGDLIQIENSSDGYIVTFKGNNKSIEISNTELDKNTMVYGDIDTRIFITAFEKILKRDFSYLESSVGNRSWLEYFYNQQQEEFSEYISNQPKYYNTHPNLNLFSKEQLLNLWQHYTVGDISNWIVGFNGSDEKIGQIGAHAYSVKNLTEDYIELVNPWDDRDSVKYSLDDFLTMGYKCRFYGYDKTEITNFANSKIVDYSYTYECQQSSVKYNPFNVSDQNLSDEIIDIEYSINNIKSLIFQTKLKNISNI